MGSLIAAKSQAGSVSGRGKGGVFVALSLKLFHPIAGADAWLLISSVGVAGHNCLFPHSSSAGTQSRLFVPRKKSAQAHSQGRLGLLQPATCFSTTVSTVGTSILAYAIDLALRLGTGLQYGSVVGCSQWPTAMLAAVPVFCHMAVQGRQLGLPRYSSGREARGI